MVRRHFISIAMVLAGFVVVASLYSRMPNPVPIHWNIRGVADGYMHKPWGPYLMPMTNAGILALMLGLSAISPKGYKLDTDARAFRAITSALTAFFFVFTVIIALVQSGSDISINRAVSLLVGALFVVLGNYMGKLTKNFFVGIRTPWTLASDEVWLRTHRLGGKLFVAAGLVSIAGAWLPFGLTPLLVAAIFAAVMPIAYSYFLYRRIHGDKSD